MPADLSNSVVYWPEVFIKTLNCLINCHRYYNLAIILVQHKAYVHHKHKEQPEHTQLGIKWRMFNHNNIIMILESMVVTMFG